MLSNTTLRRLEEQVAEFFNRTWILEKSRKLRDSVAIDPNLQCTLGIEGLGFKARTLDEKILLGVFQWFTDSVIGCYINLWLEENWGGDQREVKEALNDSKDSALGYLLVSDRWNDRDFFGNFLKEARFDFYRRSFVLKAKKSKPKMVQRRRGYNDHGTLPSRTNPEPVYDYTKLRTVQQQLEVEVELDLKISNLLEAIRERLYFENFISYFE